MSYIPPSYSDEEIIAIWEAKAVHWERQAEIGPADEAWCCLDYAKHIRTMIECKRMDLLEVGMTVIDFDYALDEIVQMDGKGLVTLRTALIHMPDRVGPLGVLYRDKGKAPALFDARQIQALLDKHRKELEAGNPPNHREADEGDFT